MINHFINNGHNSQAQLIKHFQKRTPPCGVNHSTFVRRSTSIHAPANLQTICRRINKHLSQERRKKIPNLRQLTLDANMLCVICHLGCGAPLGGAL